MLRISGLCASPTELDWSALDALCAGEARVDETERLSNLGPRQRQGGPSGPVSVRGEGVRLLAVIARAQPLPSATHVMVHDDGDYRACLALAGEAKDAVLAHRSEGKPLADGAGGPVRLLVPTSGNACLSVKRVTRLELLDHAEPDTVPRPTTPLRT